MSAGRRPRARRRRGLRRRPGSVAGERAGRRLGNPDPPTGTEAPNEPLLTLSIPRGHWNSPVIADGRIALGYGDGNDHATSGAFTIGGSRPPEVFSYD